MIHFFLGGRFCGSAPTPLIEAEPRRWGLPSSALIFCPHCGDVWGKIAVDGAGWSSWPISCKSCPSHWSLIAGSIWYHFEHLAEAFPDAVLRWELERHLDWYDKEPNHGKQESG